MSVERVSEKNKPDDKEKETRSLADRLELVRKLISNQYGVVHHAERYIFDLAKVASIVLGVISLVGIPQLLFFESENVILGKFARGIVAAMIFYAVICFIVIMLAIGAVGGINLRLKGTFKASLWWYSDERFTKLKAKTSEDLWNRIEPVYNEIQDKLVNTSDDELFEEELLTLIFLYIRADIQLHAARRMRYALVGGLFFALGGFLAGLFF